MPLGSLASDVSASCPAVACGILAGQIVRFTNYSDIDEARAAAERVAASRG
jgi:hypothetical protein